MQGIRYRRRDVDRPLLEYKAAALRHHQALTTVLLNRLGANLPDGLLNSLFAHPYRSVSGEMEVQESGRWGVSDGTALLPNSFADGRILKGTSEYFRAFHYPRKQLFFLVSTTFSNQFEVVWVVDIKNGDPGHILFFFIFVSKVRNHHIAHMPKRHHFDTDRYNQAERCCQDRTA